MFENLNNTQVEDAKKYMFAVSQPNYGTNLMQNVSYSGKLTILGGVLGLFYGVATRRGAFACACVGALCFGGVSFLVNSCFDNNKFNKI